MESDDKSPDIIAKQNLRTISEEISMHSGRESFKEELSIQECLKTK